MAKIKLTLPVTGSSGGSGGATNLSYTASPTNGTVTSDTGSDATIPLADNINAGLLEPSKYTVLENTSGTNTGDQDLSGKQDVLVSGTNIKTINSTSILGSGDIVISGGGDMTTTTDQIVSGIKTFLAGKLGIRNVANTFTSFFSSAATAARTYTLQNRNGTLLDDTDLGTINTSIAGKMANPTGGIASYLPKFLTATTIGLSRLWDTGTYFGIETTNTPTKHITLGNQANREIGVEESSNTVAGRDLTVSAGRSINYLPNSNFNQFQYFNSSPMQLATAPDNTIYIARADGSGALQRKLVGAPSFTTITTPIGYLYGITVAYNGNVYISGGAGNVYMQTGGAGSFVDTGFGIPSVKQMASAVNGNIYGFTATGIYMQTGGSGAFNLLQSGNFTGGAGKFNGDVFALSGGFLWKQTAGTGLFVNTGVASMGNILTIAPNNNFYTTSSSQIYLQTNNTGVFNSLGQINNDWAGITSDMNNNIYVGCSWSGDGYLYFQNNDSVGTPNLNGGTYKAKAGTGKGTGKSRFEIWTGQKTASGTDMQTDTLREYIDENGYHIYTSMPIYADNTSAVAGGLPVGCEYRTATGVKMIVY